MKSIVRHSLRATTLLELLVVAGIILIIAGISLTYHAGALDSGDLRYVLPKIEKMIGSFQRVGGDLGAIVVVEFVQGESTIRISIRKGEPIEPESIDTGRWGDARAYEMSFLTEMLRRKLREKDPLHAVAEWNLTEAGLIKRKLTFGDYTWEDGATEPRTFTFIPNTPAQGGEVEFGTIYANSVISLRGDRISWEID